MRLVEFQVKKFKGIEHARLENIGSFNILVGRNNVGKSSLLDALEIFLNNLGRDGRARFDGQIFPNGVNDYPVHFEAVFQLSPEEIEGRDVAPIQLYTQNPDVSEFIRNNDYLEIAISQELDPTLDWYPSVITFQPNVVVEGNINAIADFLKRKIVDIRRIDVVRGQVPASDNRSGMRTPIIPKQTLDTIKSWVDDRTKPENQRKMTNLRNLFKRLTGEDWMLQQEGINLSIQDGSYLAELRAMGGGIQEMVELAFQLINATSILMIEEPESHSHPGQAKVVFEVLRDLSHDRQLFITTHSPVFASQSEFSEIYEVIKVSGKTVCRKIENKEFSEIASNLGLSPVDVYMTSSLLFVEGECDEVIVKSWGNHLGINLSHPKTGLILMNGMGRAKYLTSVWKQIVDHVSLPMSWLFDFNVKSRLLRDLESLGVSSKSLIKLEYGNIEDYYPIDRIIEFILENYDVGEMENDDIKTKIKGDDRESRIQKFLYEFADPQPDKNDWKKPLATYVASKAKLSDYTSEIIDEIRRIMGRISNGLQHNPNS